MNAPRSYSMLANNLEHVPRLFKVRRQSLAQGFTESRLFLYSRLLDNLEYSAATFKLVGSVRPLIRLKRDSGLVPRRDALLPNPLVRTQLYAARAAAPSRSPTPHGRLHPSRAPAARAGLSPWRSSQSIPTTAPLNGGHNLSLGIPLPRPAVNPLRGCSGRRLPAPLRVTAARARSTGLYRLWPPPVIHRDD